MGSRRVVVIGSGFGGIAAAIRLAARGHAVTLLERRDRPGGCADVYRQDGFTFDGGPTTITAPWLISELFALAGRTAEDHVTLVPVAPVSRCFFPDGEHFDLSGDVPEMVERIRRFSFYAGDAGGYLDVIARTKEDVETWFADWANALFPRVTDLVRAAPDLVRSEAYRSTYGFAARFVRDERLRQALSWHALLVGGNPFETPRTSALIHHLEPAFGVHAAIGGTGAVVQALLRLLAELGGTIRLNAEVGEISISGGRATGVRLTSGEEIAADLVVCNAEVVEAYRTLLPAAMRGRYTDRRLGRMRFSPSLVVISFGTDRQYRGTDGPALAHQNVLFGPRYRALLEEIFSAKRLSTDLLLHPRVPSLTDPSLAPEGCETFSVLAPVPHLGGRTNWARAARPYRDRIMRVLEERLLPGLSRHLVTERMIDPRHFQTELHSHLGAAFSLEPTLTQSAWYRPHHRAEHLPNLYFVGAGTHPGAGLPGVLLGAKLVDAMIAGETGAPEAR